MSQGSSLPLIRVYNPRQDGEQVFTLYQRLLDTTWPLSSAQFHTVLTEHPNYRSGDHFVAVSDRQIVGIVATQIDRSSSHLHPTGHLALLLVDPAWQHQQIGRTLLSVAMTYLQQAGVSEVQLGGGPNRLWPGVPENLPPAVSFFQRCGWDYPELSYDLVMSLPDYQVPEAALAQLEQGGYRLMPGSELNSDTVLRFVAREFPNWHQYYQRTLQIQTQPENVLTAVDTQAQVVGTLLLSDVYSDPMPLWPGILGEKVGGLGAVGVAEAHRGRGIATAMVVQGSEMLRTRGLTQSYIGWAAMPGLYEQAGYSVWRRYHMAWQRFQTPHHSR